MATGNPSNKRKRVSDTIDSNPGLEKRRGRPKVYKQDEDASDRRRTQIRLAQRAYRQRKEDTLEVFHGRVSELTSIVHQMHEVFVRYQERVLASEVLFEAEVEHVSSVAREFEELVAKVNYDGGKSGPEVAKAAPKASPSSIHTVNRASESVQANNVQDWLDESDLGGKQRATIPGETATGYAISPTNETEASRLLKVLDFDPLLESSVNEQLELVSSTTTSDVTSGEVFDDTFRFIFQPDPPFTSSVAESTLARAIHRASVENSYQLLFDDRERPGEFERRFRLTLMGRSRERIAAGLKATLDKGPFEDLSNWQAPLIHVGGAGTHYERRDAFGVKISRRKSSYVGMIGPQTLAMLQSGFRDAFSEDMTVELEGYEGEWFDPYDVQGYLEERGIFINPFQSFVEAEIVQDPLIRPDISSFVSTSSANAYDSIASQIDTSFNVREHLGTSKLSSASMSDLGLDLPASLDTAAVNLGNLMGPENVWSDLTPQELALTVPAPSVSPLGPGAAQRHAHSWKKKVIIDVSKLIEVLMTFGVCLSRSPGFRRWDVDRALALASIEAF